MARQISGIVSSDKGDKTIVVTARVRKTHPIYKKQFTLTKKYMAHDEKNEARPGDQVIITETRPISRSKAHRLLKIVERPDLSQEALVHAAAPEEKTVARPDSKAKAAKEEEAAEPKETKS